MEPPDIDALTEALLWATEWEEFPLESHPMGAGDRWFYDGSLREFAEAIVAEWEHAQENARRRATREDKP